MSTRNQRLAHRLFVLNGGRSLYLNFLRNLTPQVMLMTIGLIAGSKIDGPDVLAVAATTIFIGSALLAFWLNAQEFQQQFSSPWVSWRTTLERRLTAKNIHGFRRRVVAKARMVWRYRLVEFIEQLFVMYLFMFALVAVVGMAGFAAMSALNMRHAG